MSIHLYYLGIRWITTFIIPFQIRLQLLIMKQHQTLEGDTNDTSPQILTPNRTRSGRVIKKPAKYGDFVSYQVHPPISTCESATEYTNLI
jgi:hypothetical protein